MTTALVTGGQVRAVLAHQGANARAVALADHAAEQASAYVGAYCSRLVPGEPVPVIVERVTLAVACRMASNPLAVRSVSAEGQSAELPPVGFTYMETTLLAGYRRRTA